MKAKVGQKVWILDNMNNPTEIEIWSMVKGRIRFFFNNKILMETQEDKIFPTRDALIAQLNNPTEGDQTT